jgi:2-polyprenyl-3-methyl-5-hydroxy-6-metoxy-1,4-benzoquinol methylase
MDKKNTFNDEIEDIKEVYILHHEKYRRTDYIYGGELRIEPIITRLAELSGNKKVLDLGCRDCALADRYIHLFNKKNFKGVDIDSKAVQRAQEKGYEVENEDINRFLKTEKIKYDLIVASEILEHLPYPKETIRLMYNVLDKKGLVLVTVPNAYRLKNRLKFLFGMNFDSDYTHLRAFNGAMLKEFFLENNFRLKYIEYINSRFLWLSRTLFGHTILGLFEK